MRRKSIIHRAAMLAAATTGVMLICSSALAQRTEPPPPSPEKQAMIDLGIEHGTAWDLYQYFKEQAGDDTMLEPAEIPDWSGVWTRAGILFFWDQDQDSTFPTNNLPTAKLRPDARQRLIQKLDDIDRGIEYDPLSAGKPAGMPRWFTEPFLRDFAVTPHTTYLINEMMNEVRRVYTDGRGHTPPEDAYPIWQGDSIGFWDGQRLIAHTNSMRSGQYQRPQPEYSDQVETVEIWEKVDDETIVVDVWTYDPPVLLEPWYTRHTYKKLTNDDHFLRIRYWDFTESQNNAITVTEEGGSDFTDFDFTNADD
jgi:hypothetical protein